MEEILASIRRIIADDDASKPAKAPETAAPPKQPPAAAVPGRPAPPGPPPKSVTPPPPAASKPAAPTPAATASSKDEIDAMLAELDAPPKTTAKSAATQSATPADVFDLTESMATPAMPRRTGAKLPHHRRDIRRRGHHQAWAVTGSRADLERDHCGRRQRLQHACAYSHRAERSDARRSCAGNAAADAQVLARRQFAGHGGTHRTCGD